MFSEIPIDNIDRKSEDTDEILNRKPCESNSKSDQKNANYTLNKKSYIENNRHDTNEPELKKRDTYVPFKSSSNDLYDKNYKAHDNLNETEHFNTIEKNSALKQIESMMGRNYSDFMRSLASKYNQE